jgi:pimeloyl-ACP methyl ester carboxylesterase
VPGRVLLVGHSYRGAVMTNAATGNQNVKALVYVDAFAPDEGELVLPLTGPDSALAVPDPTTVFDLRPYPGAPAGDFDVYLQPEVVVNSFAQDLPRRTAQTLAATQRPIAFSAGLEPSEVPAWKTIPSWYLIGSEDLIIPAAQQRFMAERAGAQIVEVRASHVSLISKPNRGTTHRHCCRGHHLTCSRPMVATRARPARCPHGLVLGVRGRYRTG